MLTLKKKQAINQVLQMRWFTIKAPKIEMNIY